MPYKDRLFEDITPERYYLLRGRFDKFLIDLDKDVEPISVYEPFRKQQLDQLTVIREISKELQKAKEEDILKAKQAAEEAASKAEAEKQEAKAKEGEEDAKETEKNDSSVNRDTNIS